MTKGICWYCDKYSEDIEWTNMKPFGIHWLCKKCLYKLCKINIRKKD